MSKEFIVVHQIDKAGSLGESIPLHMTALHWFKSPVSGQEIVGQLEEFAAGQGAISVRATDTDLFGPNKDIPVMRLELSVELVRLHLGLLAVARSMGAELDERWVGAARWSPHVTHKGESRLYPGEALRIDDLDLIARGQDRRRELMARINLGDSGGA